MDGDNSSSDSEKTIKELQPNPLKKLSIEAIENAFSKALLALTDEGYEVDIHTLTLRESFSQPDATMQISIRKKAYLGNSPFS